MSRNLGFSLIEVLIAIALLGLIAFAVAAFPHNYDNAMFTQNLAGQLAESQIEVCRNIASEQFENLIGYTATIPYHVNTRGQIIDYVCNVSTQNVKVDPAISNTSAQNYTINIDTVPNNGTVSLDNANPKPDIIQVIVRVTINNVEVTRRTALISR